MSNLRNDLTIANICSKYNMKTQHIEPSRFVFNEEHKLIGCLINKVGSTTLLDAFLKLRNVNVSVQDIWDYKHLITPEDEKQVQKLNNFYKFIITREPMERLASCYFDKVITNTAPG